MQSRLYLLYKQEEPYMTDKQWIHEKCNTNTPPETIPSEPPTIKAGEKVGLIIDNIELTKNTERLSKENEKLKSQITSQDCEIYDLNSKLQAKEQECEELKKDCPKRCKSDTYKQALDEVEKYFKSKDTSKTSLFNIFVIEQELLDIINKAKDGE